MLTYDSQSFLLGREWGKGSILFVFGCLSRWPFTTHSETKAGGWLEFLFDGRETEHAAGRLVLFVFERGAPGVVRSRIGVFLAFPVHARPGSG